MFQPQITAKSSLHIVRQIWDVLEKRERMECKRSCFGHFVELDTQLIRDPYKGGIFRAVGPLHALQKSSLQEEYGVVVQL